MLCGLVGHLKWKIHHKAPQEEEQYRDTYFSSAPRRRLLGVLLTELTDISGVVEAITCVLLCGRVSHPFLCFTGNHLHTSHSIPAASPHSCVSHHHRVFKKILQWKFEPGNVLIAAWV